MATDLVTTATAIPASNGIGYGQGPISPTAQAYTVYGHIGDPGTTTINEYSAMTIPAFMRGVRFLSETLAGLPKQVFRKSGPSVRQRDHTHYLDNLINDSPNDMVDAVNFWTSIYHAAIVHGNGYALITRDRVGNVAALYNLPPEVITPWRADGKQYYAFSVDGEKPQAIDGSEILHVQGFGSDGMRGYPIVQLMMQSLRIGKAAETYAANYFSQGGNVGGTIENDNELTTEQIADLRLQVNQQAHGPTNAHKWLVLSNGNKAKPLALQNDQAQMLETRQFSVLDVARALSVEPFVLYEYGRATWGNLEQMGTALVRYSLLPWILKTEQQLNRKLFNPGERSSGFYFGINVDSLTRADHQQLIADAVKRSGGPYMTVNEERALQDLPPVQGGDVIRTPTNEVPLGSQATTPTVPEVVPEPKPVQAAASTVGVTFDAFRPMVTYAAARVDSKTAKAVTGASSKMGTAAYTPWANSFASTQEAVAAAAVTPVLETFASTAGKHLDHVAHGKKIGTKYAAALRRHLYAVGRGETSTPPDLTKITFTHSFEDENEKE